jgi:hypothetical protein
MRPTIVTATIIYTIILLPTLILAPFAAFLYDDPSAGGIVLHTFSLFWFTFPATLLASILGAWVTHVREKDKAATIFLLLPVFHAAILVTFGILHFESHIIKCLFDLLNIK